MSKATMTSRERVNRMFKRQDHDRVPRSDSFWGDTITRWQREGLNGDAGTVLEMLETDLHGIGGAWPCPFPGTDKVVAEDEETRTTRDAHGKTVRYWKNKAGTPEHVGFGCTDRATWEREYKPALLRNWLQVDVAAAKDSAGKAEQNQRWRFYWGVETFEQTRQLLGDEATMIALAEDPEWIADISRTYADVMLRNWNHLYDAGIPLDLCKCSCPVLVGAGTCASLRPLTG